jgi:hypothetical protein
MGRSAGQLPGALRRNWNNRKDGGVTKLWSPHTEERLVIMCNLVVRLQNSSLALSQASTFKQNRFEGATNHFSTQGPHMSSTDRPTDLLISNIHDFRTPFLHLWANGVQHAGCGSPVADQRPKHWVLPTYNIKTEHICSHRTELATRLLTL